MNPTGIPDEAGVGGGPVLVLADLDRYGRMWNAWAVLDEQGDVIGAFADVEGAIQWEGGSIAKARALVAQHCG